jgi:nitrate/nitrite transport system substrate-binding protein
MRHLFRRSHRPGACACGLAHPLGGVKSAGRTTAGDDALLAGLFPEPVLRRALLKTVGAAALLGALGDLIPLGTLRALAAEPAPPEKPDLTVGFLAITCAAPLIFGVERGIFAKHGLNVSLQKVPGIALIRDKMLNGEIDVSQQVMPVPLSTTLGIGGQATPTKVLTILNQNGNALVLANKHKDNRDPRNWRGFKFAIPFDQSHQALQLRAYLADVGGLDPDKDVSFRVVPPSEYVSNLRIGAIDGFLGGEPGGQRAVYEGAGFIHLVSKELWDGHPCCAVAATDAWIKAHPNTFLAVFRAVIEAGLYANDPKNRAGMAKVLAQPNYLNAPETVIEQVIGGRFADGLGAVRTVPDRVTYDPLPQYSAAVWLTAQMKRWNMVKGDVDAQGLARSVLLAQDARAILVERGADVPEPGFRTETILGRAFDSSRPI